MAAAPAHAAAKKPPQTPACNANPGLSTPTPVRKVVLRPVATKAFQLPNGKQVDLSADLNTMLNTAVAATTTFSPTDPAAPGTDDPCNTHLELRAAVTTLELNAAQFGISFGYSPSGSTSTISNLTGSADVTIGTIAMDFSVWECVGGNCSAVAANTATHLTAGVNLSFTVDFSGINLGPNFVYNTPLGGILRAIMDNGMAQLSKSPRLEELSWSATVREFLPDAGLVVFDAGVASRLAPNQTFVVYAATPSTGICNVYQAVAHVHTTQVETVSSTAIVDQVLDSRGIKDGDVVMIRPAGGPPR